MTLAKPLTLALLLALAAPAFAQQAPPPIDARAQRAVVEALARQLTTNYVFPDVATKVAAELKARDARGAYAKATDVQTFARALGDDLRTAGHDLHFNVAYDPDFRAAPSGPHAPPSREDAERMRRDVERHTYGIDSVRRLEGNVGYMELRAFAPAAYVADAITASIKLLAGTDALILDLRRNGGGEPETVAYLLSHFFPEGDSRHLNDIYSRADGSTRQYWTSPSVGVHYDKPVYVLTSRRTFSGGEEAAYDFQTQQRATLVGEITGGGANPGEGYPLAHGFAAFIPNGRSINPVTKANWEHTGVKPNIAVPAADAQKVAHAAALKARLAASKDAEEQGELKELIAAVEADTLPPPNYAPPRR
ncbi:S41 family peptidase [Cognatilysobacter segetis]|uniref:S41 family peptidase n=1 Tax=Cognatilysobacter segetis TaxID=2492394 RepID=UPI001061917F|nr:S41 family peptidase [Lysobacter segetis]